LFCLHGLCFDFRFFDLFRLAFGALRTGTLGLQFCRLRFYGLNALLDEGIVARISGGD
jgi:hypothetical protein